MPDRKNNCFEEITDSTPIGYQVQLILHEAGNRCSEHGTVKLLTSHISDMVRGRVAPAVPVIRSRSQECERDCLDSVEEK
jgi:hypothetical protein